MAAAAIGRVFRRMNVEAVCGPHANRGEKEPGDKPEKVERQAKDGGIDAVPERDGEADGDEGNEAEQERGERGFLHGRNPVEMFCRMLREDCGEGYSAKEVASTNVRKGLAQRGLRAGPQQGRACRATRRKTAAPAETAGAPGATWRRCERDRSRAGHAGLRGGKPPRPQKPRERPALHGEGASGGEGGAGHAGLRGGKAPRPQKARERPALHGEDASGGEGRAGHAGLRGGKAPRPQKPRERPALHFTGGDDARAFADG